MNLVATLPELRAYAQKQDDEREAFEAKLNATKEEVSFQLSEQKTKIEQIEKPSFTNYQPRDFN